MKTANILTWVFTILLALGFRLIMAELQVTDVREQVMLSQFTDFENFQTFKPAAMHE